MTTSKPVSVAALIAGFLLGAVSAQPKLRHARAELADTRHLAEHDSLTGLLNRTGAHSYYHRRTTAGQYAAVLLDLDGFKTVNDTWGHQTGDMLLKALATRLSRACTAIGATASRLAGDEFLLLLPHCDARTAVVEAVKILDRLGAPIRLPLEDGAITAITPTASAGIALPRSDGSWSDLLRRADIALYQAKSRPGHVVLHTPDMNQPPVRNRRERQMICVRDRGGHGVGMRASN